MSTVFGFFGASEGVGVGWRGDVSPNGRIHILLIKFAGGVSGFLWEVGQSFFGWNGLKLKKRAKFVCLSAVEIIGQSNVIWSFKTYWEGSNIFFCFDLSVTTKKLISN